MSPEWSCPLIRDVQNETFLPKSDEIMLTNASRQPSFLSNAVQGFQSKLVLDFGSQSAFGIFLKLKENANSTGE